MTFNAKKYIAGLKKLEPYLPILSKEELDEEREKFIERNKSKTGCGESIVMKSPDVQGSNENGRF